MLANGMKFHAGATVYSLTSLDGQDVDFEHQTYSYGLREASGTWIWRFDKHIGDHHKLGALDHVHRGAAETPHEHHDMDLADVVYELTKDGHV